MRGKLQKNVDESCFPGELGRNTRVQEVESNCEVVKTNLQILISNRLIEEEVRMTAEKWERLRCGFFLFLFLIML